MSAPLSVLRGVFTPAQIAEVRRLFTQSAFRALAAGAGPSDANVFVALPEESEPARRAAELVAGTLEGNQSFASATFPSAMTAPRFYRYDLGMGYAEHTDLAFHGGSAPLRRDIALTVVLSEPSSYEGGDLVFDPGGMQHRVRGELGDCILYSPDLSHAVEPVTRGSRWVAVSWIQSTVRGFERRHILSELTRLVGELETGAPPEPHVEALHHGYSNLIRLWL
jgi:PKHD-type hydroxylase